MTTTNNMGEQKRIANLLVAFSGYTRAYNSQFRMAYDSVWAFLNDVAKTNSFGAKIAQSIMDWNEKASVNTMPRISSKQAWAMACAAVENNIAF